nr:hypothetical protein [Deltaproteobacteria bacterium]
MFCALDKIDLAATVDGQTVAIQTDHRASAEVESELALSILFAITRVVNARGEAAQVHYVVADPPAAFAEALHAVGAVIAETSTRLIARDAPPPDDERAGQIADACFRELAQRVAARVGTRDPAMALRMLEDETYAAPPTRDDPGAFWR